MNSRKYKYDIELKNGIKLTLELNHTGLKILLHKYKVVGVKRAQVNN